MISWSLWIHFVDGENFFIFLDVNVLFIFLFLIFDKQVFEKYIG